MRNNLDNWADLNLDDEDHAPIAFNPPINSKMRLTSNT